MKRKSLILAIVMLLTIVTSAYAGSQYQNIKVLFNDITIEVNGEKVTANNILYDGTTFVPLRKAAEMLGAEVTWDGNTRTAGINLDVSNTTDSDKVIATIVSVTDGDTVKIHLDGKEESVRLLLVDTPETVHPTIPEQPFGEEASNFAKETLTVGKEVTLEYDGDKRDHYDRLLGYIWVDGKNFNQMLLEKGLARLAYVYEPPYKHYDAFVKAQTKAVNAKVGIWSKEGYVTEDGFVTEDPNPIKEEVIINDPEVNDTDLKYDSNDKTDRNCGDFDSHLEAQEFFDAVTKIYNEDIHGLDRDKDGVVCESLG